MKCLFTITICIFFIGKSIGQQQHKSLSQPDTTKKIEVVEVSCGQCKLNLLGKGCNLALRINGKSYFIDGTSIDEHGDAHANEGFCNAIRKAQVQGQVVNNRFILTYFKLIDLPKGKKKE